MDPNDLISALAERDSGGSGSSSSEEIEWEDVDIGERESSTTPKDSTKDDRVKVNPVNVVLKNRRKRKPETNSRIVQLIHIQSLMYHGFVRNKWLNDRNLQLALKKQVPKELRKEFKKYHNRPDKKIDLSAVLERLLIWFRRCYKVTKEVEGVGTLKQCKAKMLTFTGSLDMGAQLFTAMLRGLGVEARLVYSIPVGYNRNNNAFPTFWSEVSVAAGKEFVPVDPLVLDESLAIGNCARYEPKGQFAQGMKLLYVIGYEPHSTHALNLTPKYKESCTLTAMYAYFLRYMKMYGGDEKMGVDYPSTLSAYRGHPTLVLASQLRQNQVINAPAVHSFKVGRRTEKVYSREHVQTCYSEMFWFRKGRAVKQSLKPRKVAHTKRNLEGILKEEQLYSFDQTTAFRHAPVENGVIPQNKFGYIECFVPQMIPENGVHLKLENVEAIARQLGINFSPAVTDFSFRHRTAKPVVDGVVVAKENESMLRRACDSQIQTRALTRWRSYLVKLRLIKSLREKYS